MKSFWFGALALMLASPVAQAAEWTAIDIMGESDVPLAVGVTTDATAQVLYPPVEGKCCGGISWSSFTKDLQPEGFVELMPCEQNTLICVSDFPDMTDARCTTGSMAE